ncbi:MAG: glycosyltransferase [Gemmataceae bacterium]
MVETLVVKPESSRQKIPVGSRCEGLGYPIRVCFLIDELAAAGTETQLLALIRRLDRRRVQPFLCLLRGEAEQSRALEPDDCPVLRLNIRSLAKASTLKKVWRLVRFLKKESIEVIQVYFPESTYVGVLAGRLAGVPHVVRTRNNLGYWMTPAHRFLGKLSNHLTSVMIANCEACRQAVLRDEGVAPERIIVLENGVDLARFSVGKRAASSGRSIGVVANLRPVKGLEVFIRAASMLASRYPDLTFSIAGEGEQRAFLESLADELGLGSRVLFRGSVANVPDFLAEHDVVALPSHSEGMSNALLEYMAAGKAIVATKVGGNITLIEDGVHGLLVPPNDPTLLAGAIGQLLGEPTLAARLGGAARHRVEQHYSREAMVRRFEDFYEALTRNEEICGSLSS